MKKYILSSSAFEGTVELIYIQDALHSVVALDAQMTIPQLQYLFKQVPIDVKELPEFQAKLKDAVIVSADFEVSLEDFKHEYPYARNMHLLPDIWKKMRSIEQFKALQGAKAYRRYCDRNKDWYKPKIAAAWLKAKEYLNDWPKM